MVGDLNKGIRIDKFYLTGAICFFSISVIDLYMLFKMIFNSAPLLSIVRSSIMLVFNCAVCSVFWVLWSHTKPSNLGSEEQKVLERMLKER